MYGIEIIKRNGTKIDLADHQVFAQDFIISSIKQDDSFSTQEGKQGRRFNGSEDRFRTISIPFFTYDKYLHNFTLIRDEIFSIFGREDFWVREKREGEYVSGKQYLVKLTNVIELKQQYKFSTHSLVFETTESPYGVSISSTQDIQTKGLINDDTWAYGMGLETNDDTELIYTHNSKKFKIFNAGTEPIHPFEADLKIEIRNVVGSTAKFTLVNRTNNSRFTITKSVSNSDVWLIDGPVIKRNSLAAARDTTKSFVYLEPGWNQFEILDATSAQIKFDFKFLYR